MDRYAHPKAEIKKGIGLITTATNIKQAASERDGRTPHLIGSVDDPTSKSPLISSTSFIISLDVIANIALKKRIEGIKYALTAAPPKRNVEPVK